MPQRNSDRTAETRLNAQLLLRAYQIVIEQGVARDDAYVLNGIRASLDVDGYGVTLTDGTVTTRVLFHNKVAIDAPGRRALASFRRRLHAITEKTR